MRSTPAPSPPLASLIRSILAPCQGSIRRRCLPIHVALAAPDRRCTSVGPPRITQSSIATSPPPPLPDGYPNRRDAARAAAKRQADFRFVRAECELKGKCEKILGIAAYEEPSPTESKAQTFARRERIRRKITAADPAARRQAKSRFNRIESELKNECSRIQDWEKLQLHPYF